MVSCPQHHTEAGDPGSGSMAMPLTEMMEEHRVGEGTIETSDWALTRGRWVHHPDFQPGVLEIWLKHNYLETINQVASSHSMLVRECMA